MRSPTLLTNLTLAYSAGAVASALNTNDDSNIIDMAGFEGVIFLSTIEDSVATGVASMIVEQNAANSGAGMAALSGAVATLTCGSTDDLNGKVLAVDVYRPKERYLRVNRTSSVANIAFGSVTAIRYGQRVTPTPDTAATGDLVSVTSPIET